MSNGSIIISCIAATISVILSLWPWYDRSNYFILLTKVFIQFVHMSIVEFNNAIEFVDDSIGIKNVADYVIE